MSTVNPAEISQRLKDEIAALNVTHGFEEAGRVERVGDGIARIEGLEKIMVGELVEFDDGTQGMALNLEDNFVGVVVMGSDAGIKEGDAVRLTGRTADVPVGDALLGRVVNSLGEPIDGKGTIYASGRRPVESDAPSVIVRKEVNEPLFTGTKAIDALVPIGKGQRELIIGDRETGKTAIAIDAILNQKGQDVNCVYVAIGQKASTVARIISRLTEEGAMDYTTIVLATAADPAPLQYIAPYAGTAIAEHWMHEGKDTLVVYDDLSKHAVAYREISLLLGRPPGREAYPGDVFYLHSRLLERSASMDEEHGGGSLTALPIVETQGGDISAYIPTNVISITDGQIYLEANLFNSGVRPAINPGLSVSRVGGSAQIDAMKKIAGPLRIEYAQYNELSAFAQFGSDLNPDTLARLEHGERIVEVLKQRQYDPKDIAEQVIILYALSEGHLRDVPVQQVAQFEDDLIAHINNFESDIKREIIETGQVSKVLEERIQDIIDDILNQYEYED